MVAMKRVGIMGGTFDPLHIGHLVAARCAAEQAKLDEVLFMVAGEPWQKSSERRISPTELRFRAVEAAIEGIDDFIASRAEIDRPGPSYMVETLESLAGADVELALIGGEALLRLDTWHRGSEIPALAELLVVGIEGASTGGQPVRADSQLIAMPRLDISSTYLREQIASGNKVDFLVPQEALDVYRAAGLYA